MEHLDTGWEEPSFREKFRFLIFVFIVLLSMAALSVFLLGTDGILRMFGLKDKTLQITLSLEAIPHDSSLELNNVSVDNPLLSPVSWPRGNSYRVDASHPAYYPEYVLINIPLAPNTSPEILPSSEGIDIILDQDLIEIHFQLKPEYVKVSIESKPSGASIVIDGIDTKKITPLEYELKAGQSVKIEVSKAGYQEATTEYQVPDFPPEKPLEFELKRKPSPSTATPKPSSKPTPKPPPEGSLQVNSDFPVDVYRGSSKIIAGKTRASVRLPTGKHTIRLVNSTYLLDIDQTVTIIEKRTHTITLDSLGKVILDSNPPGAIIEVAGHTLGKTPGTFEVYPGLYNMRFKFDQCDDEQSIWVKAVSKQTRNIPAVRGCLP